MTEERKAFLDTPEGEDSNTMARLIQAVFPGSIQNPVGLKDLEESFAEDIKGRTLDDIFYAITRANGTITDKRAAPLLRLMARKQRDLLLAEVDRRFPV